jgi:hypothetical protein
VRPRLIPSRRLSCRRSPRSRFDTQTPCPFRSSLRHRSRLPYHAQPRRSRRKCTGLLRRSIVQQSRALRHRQWLGQSPKSNRRSRSDLHRRSRLRSDLHRRSRLRSDLHRRSRLRSDLHRRSRLRSDLHRRSPLGTDLHRRSRLRTVRRQPSDQSLGRPSSALLYALEVGSGLRDRPSTIRCRRSLSIG